LAETPPSQALRDPGEPAARARETVSALGARFKTDAAVGTSADAAGLIAAAAWPDRPGAILIVGHQPTLGRVAATLLSGAQADWHMAKGAVWWLRHVEGETKLSPSSIPNLRDLRWLRARAASKAVVQARRDDGRRTAVGVVAGFEIRWKSAENHASFATLRL